MTPGIHRRSGPRLRPLARSRAGNLLAAGALALLAAAPGCPGASDGAVAGDGAAAVAPSPASADGHERMVRLLAEIAERSQDDHLYLGQRRARELRERIRAAGDGASWRDRMDLGIAELQLGDERGGIEELLRARALLGQAPDPSGLLQTTFYLGVAQLRLGETENCCEVRAAESCIVPLRGRALHTREEGSRGAIPYFREILESVPADNYWSRASRWLLNLAYMTLGEYPDGVPAEYRIPERAFESTIDFPRFRNVAGDLGLDSFHLAGGVVVDDFDGDDDLDILVSTWDTAEPLRLFRNDGGTFTERGPAAGLSGLLGGLNLVQADYDNDGDLDFLVLRGAWLYAGGRHPNSLVRNEGDGTFRDVTFEAGLGDVHYPTQAAAWADYDGDGDLDLYVGNEASPGAEYPSQLFRNDGDGSFTDVAARAGVLNLRYAKGVSWGDYDGDGDPDLYVSNKDSANRLYRNEGDGTFTDVAPAAGVTRPLLSFPTWFWDYDNDGALDLFVGAYATGVGHLTDYYVGPREPHEIAALYRGDGRGGFTDVAARSGLDFPSLPMGSNFGDLDGDGWLDFYLGTGNVYYFELMPNRMYLNREGREFVDVTMAGGFGHLQKGHGVAFADLDQDGDLDVFEQMGGAYPGDRFADALYENPGFGTRWITLRLVGRASNRSAIGARIRVDVEERGRARSIWRHVNSGGSFGASPLRQTIGLGRAERIRAIEILWPATGRTQAVEGAEPGTAIEVIEGQPGFRPLRLEPQPLRAAARPA